MMGCPACGTENPPGNRFCGGCGARLALTCPGCLRTLGRHAEAQSELTLAFEMLGEMGMTCWLPEAEAALRG